MLTLIAEAGALPSWVDELLLLAIKVLGATVIALAGWAATKLAKKLGVEHTAAFEERARAVAREALNYADRWARQQDDKPDSQAKMTKAIEYALTLPDLHLLGNNLAKLIESELEAESKANGNPT